MDKIKNVFKYIKSHSHIYIYGAGVRAKRTRECFEKHGVDFLGYVVTKRDNNPLEIEGKKVWTKDELLSSKMPLGNAIFVVSMAIEEEELRSQLENSGINNLYFLYDHFWGDLSTYDIVDSYERLQDAYCLEPNYPLLENGQMMILEKRTKTPLLRVVRYSEDLVECLLKAFSKERFETEYGEFKRLEHETHAGFSEGVAKECGVEMYVVTSHFDKRTIENMNLAGDTLIQVGAALTDERRCSLTDNVGDNISSQNRNYCECTAIYWIWKNTSSQRYVGLSHYRRRLMLSDKIVKQLDGNWIAAVMPTPEFCTLTVKEFMETFIRKEDWEYLRRFVVEYDVEYENIFDEYENSHYFFPCNIFLFERSWFNKYCDFAFYVTRKIENEYNSRNIVRQDRYMGYLFENITSVFVKRYYKELNVHCVDVEWLS